MSAENVKYVPAPAELELRLQGAFRRKATPPTEAAVVNAHFPDIAGPDRYTKHIAFVQAANLNRQPKDVLGSYTEDQRPEVLEGLINRTVGNAMRTPANEPFTGAQEAAQTEPPILKVKNTADTERLTLKELGEELDEKLGDVAVYVRTTAPKQIRR